MVMMDVSDDGNDGSVVNDNDGIIAVD